MTDLVREFKNSHAFRRLAEESGISCELDLSVISSHTSLGLEYQEGGENEGFVHIKIHAHYRDGEFRHVILEYEYYQEPMMGGGERYIYKNGDVSSEINKIV